MASPSCSAARSGYCNATVAKATKRSGCAAHASASFSFWILMIWRATSRSALYQYGLMLSASTSTPCSSIARIRSEAFDISRVSGATFKFIRAIASGTLQCACTSTVFTRRPFTTTSRRRVWACADAASARPQPTNAMPAMALADSSMNSLRVFMGLPGGSMGRGRLPGAPGDHALDVQRQELVEAPPRAVLRVQDASRQRRHLGRPIGEAGRPRRRDRVRKVAVVHALLDDVLPRAAHLRARVPGDDDVEVQLFFEPLEALDDSLRA